LVAGLIRKRALVDNGWFAERLQMGARNTVNRTIRAAKNHAQGNRAAARLAKKVEPAIK
jgi:hypothetical protein